MTAVGQPGGVVRPGEGRSFPYAGQPMRVLADSVPGFDGFAAVELTVPPNFAGPVPHTHSTFDEAIYVLDGRLLITTGYDDPVEAPPGSMCLSPRGVRHTFSNPDPTPVRVLGLWSPASAGLAFMSDIGAVMPKGGAPDPARIADLYRKHDSELLP